MPAMTPAQRAARSQIQCTISCLTSWLLVCASYQQKVASATKKKAPAFPEGLSVGRQEDDLAGYAKVDGGQVVILGLFRAYGLTNPVPTMCTPSHQRAGPPVPAWHCLACPAIACPVFTGRAATPILPPESNRCISPVLRVSVALRTSAFHAAADVMTQSFPVSAASAH